MIVILACYGVLYTFPSSGSVYAASIIASSLSSAWYPMMWPWRVQTTAKATGSAFAIGFVNSYGQIGGALGPQIFRSKYAPNYGVSFSVAMVMVGLAILANLTTWAVTGKVEKETRKLKRARIEAGKRGEAVLDDIRYEGGGRKAILDVDVESDGTNGNSSRENMGKAGSTAY